jgi:hypothetical protein
MNLQWKLPAGIRGSKVMNKYISAKVVRWTKSLKNIIILHEEKNIEICTTAPQLCKKLLNNVNHM